VDVERRLLDQPPLRAIGAVAVSTTVRGDAIEAGALLGHLRAQRIEPRIPDALRFAEENLVLLLRHQSSGVDLDLSFAWTSFEHEAIATASPVSYGSVVAPMATAQSLVVFKLIAGRPKDLEDVAALLTLHPELDRVGMRRQLSELAALAEAPELAQRLEQVFSQDRFVREPTTERTGRRLRRPPKRGSTRGK
jgi:hypothetical protein